VKNSQRTPLAGGNILRKNMHPLPASFFVVAWHDLNLVFFEIIGRESAFFVDKEDLDNNCSKVYNAEA
jgi:hypothetical protein